MRAAVIDPPPDLSRVGLMAAPPVMMAVVGIGACPRPEVLDGREGGRRDDLSDDHRMHWARIPADDLTGGEARHRHHEEPEHRANNGCVNFHKCLSRSEYGCGYLPATKAKRLLMLCFAEGLYEKSEFASIALLTVF